MRDRIFTLSSRLVQGSNVAFAVLVAMAFLSGCGTTRDLSVQTGQAWTTEAAAAEAGPKPTDHETLIRSWLKTILHVSTEAQVDIGPVGVGIYREMEPGLFGMREKAWWGWKSTVRIQKAATEQGTGAAAPMTYDVFMKESRVVFALFPNGSAITADGIRVSPGSRIPGLVQ